MTTLREEFEALAKSKGLEVELKKPDGRYWSSHTHFAWGFYQAAAERCAVLCDAIAASEQAMHNTQAEQAADACAAACRGGA
ncbi:MULTISPECIES: hypothetical protein [unclassified Variovorax]|uniref:hypothetical protein n=1 Tax=unclassified Variovorax TaxID=663243 RepID=UPI003F462FDC